jgi:hypothetical protein
MLRDWGYPNMSHIRATNTSFELQAMWSQLNGTLCAANYVQSKQVHWRRNDQSEI